MRAVTAAVLSCLGLGCGGAHPLADASLAPLPDWTDKYAATNKGDMRFFEIEGLMARYELTRLQAIELQNHYRDQSRAAPDGDPGAHFDEALRRVRAGELESGLDPAALERAPFIVVIDSYDTLYDQYMLGGASPDCHDVVVPPAAGDKKPRYIKLNPGWDVAIRRVRALGGAVVLFSANVDDKTYENLRHIRLGDTPLADHPDIAGILTNSHLVRQSKHEGRGRKNPRKGRPIAEPSKDLRLFDAKLERVVIVDDNPRRLFQLKNARVPKKFDGDALCRSEDAAYKLALGSIFSTVLAEIEESVTWMNAHQVPFATAYLPYTMLGLVAVDTLMAANGWSPAEARAHVRQHPGLVDRKF